MMKNFLFTLLIFSWSLIAAQNDNCSLGLVLSSSQATIGESVTIDVNTRQFNSIVGMQYSHAWNPEQLHFEEVIYADNSPISSTDFNLSVADTDAGTLKFVFLDNGLEGIDMPDNSTLYSLRFTYLAGSEPQVVTNGEQLPVEFIDNNVNQINNYYLIHATVSESTDARPYLNSSCIAGGSCSDPANGSIHINVDSPETLSFQWEDNNTVVSTTEDLISLASNHYSLTISNQDGQHLYGDFFASPSDGLSIILASDNDECGGTADGSVTATVSGGSGSYTYEWNNGATTASITDLEGGTYSVTVTDSDFGCSSTAEAQVDNSSTFWITQQSTPASCESSANGSINLGVDGPAGYAPFTYLWSNGNTTEDLNDITTGFYAVTITANNGCTAEYSIVLNAEELNVTANIENISCDSNDTGSISLDIETADYSLLWSNGATSTTIENLAAGDYVVTISDNQSSCTYTNEYTVATGELLTAYNVNCQTNSTELTVAIWNGTEDIYTYTWSTGDVTQSDFTSSIFVDQDGVYGVTITSPSGCTSVLDDMTVSCSNNETHLYLSPQTIEVNENDEVCLDVKVGDFTEQLGFQFTMEWDETLLSFSAVNNLGLTTLNNNSFGFPLTDDGLLSVSWIDVQGASLADGATLFSVCYDVVSDQQTSTSVSFEGFPTAIEFVNSNDVIETVTTQNAQVNLNGSNTGGDGTLELTVGSTTSFQNDLVCIPIVSSNFSAIEGLQFSLSWDPAGLEFNSIQNINLPNTTATNNFGAIEESQADGVLRFLWINNIPGDLVVLPPNTTLFEVCYIAQGEPGNYPITFSDSPLPIQVIDQDLEYVEVELANGTIEILEQTSSDHISLDIASAAVNTGEDICLPVTAIQLENLAAMQFSIQWDQDMISFNHLNVSDNLPGLSELSFNIPEGQNHLIFAWSDPNVSGQNLAPGTTIFEICFTANQIEGTTNVIFSNQPTALEFVSSDLEIYDFIPSNGQVTISTDGLVWPGDTDTNTEVDHFDLLNIGIAYGAEGPARNNASIEWLSQHAEAWEGQTPFSAINYRHMDTDGNGIVNDDDVLALEQNWGEMTEEFTGPDGGFRELEMITVPFYVQADTVEAGTEVYLPIMLGTDETSVENAYGVAFSIYYDPEMVRPNSAQVVFDGWMGAQGEDMLGFYKDQHAWGRIDIAMVRKDGQNVSGEGQIASFGIIMEDVIFRDLVDLEMLVRIENVRLINLEEEVLPTSPRESTILVENITNNNEAFELQALSVYPNPVADVFSIIHPNIEIESVHIFDTKGQLQSELHISNAQSNISQLASGMYWLQFQTDKGVAYRKIIKH